MHRCAPRHKVVLTVKTFLHLINVEHRCDPTPFTSQDVKGSRRGRRIHNFKTDATSRERKHEVPRRKNVLAAGSKDDEFRMRLEQYFEIDFGQCVHRFCCPRFDYGIRRQRDRFTVSLIADADSVVRDAAD